MPLLFLMGICFALVQMDHIYWTSELPPVFAFYKQNSDEHPGFFFSATTRLTVLAPAPGLIKT